MSLSVMPGVIVERVGDDLMVIVPGNTDVVSLSGRPAEVFLDVKAGRKVDPTDPAIRDLVDLGILAATGLSRRGLIKAGAIGAGAGIAILAMPSVAAAASVTGAAGIYQVVGSDVQFRVPLNELGGLSTPGESRDLSVDSLGISGQGSPGDDGTYAYWTGFGAAPASGTLTGTVDGFPLSGYVSIPTTFTPGSFTYPN